jgi:hypothetical protein
VSTLLSLAAVVVVASVELSRPAIGYSRGSEQATGEVIDVPAGGNLQQAINQVQPGGTIRLTAGATYVGNFTLPAKNGSSHVVITTGGATLPPPGTRIDPSYKPRLARIRSPNTNSALVTAAGASYYRIVGVAFEANQNGSGDIISLGNSSHTTLAQVPHHIEIDRVLIAGDPAAGQKRAIAVNAAHIVITDSDIRDIKAAGQDSQAIAGWNTPGPVVIRNNYLEAAGENVMFGGAHISLPGVVPSDITVEGNTLSKNPAWRGTSWTVKNIFELKAARRVTIRRNVFQYNWGGAQAGYAIVFTPRNQTGTTPWVVVEDVAFTDNLLLHSGGGFNLLGYDDMAASGQLARITIANNLVIDLNAGLWAGSGAFVLVGAQPRDITIDHNTVLHDGNIVTFYSGSYVNSAGATVSGGPIAGFAFTNNLLKHNAYGVFGSGQGFGNQSLAFYAPGAVVRRNVMASDTAVASRYPADNYFPTLAGFNASFVNALGQDYRLVPGSAYVGAGIDGKDIGCDFSILPEYFPPTAPGRLRVIGITR